MDTNVEFVPIPGVDANYLIITLEVTDDAELRFSDITRALLRRLPAHLEFRLGRNISETLTATDYYYGYIAEETEEYYESEDW